MLEDRGNVNKVFKSMKENYFQLESYLQSNSKFKMKVKTYSDMQHFNKPISHPLIPESHWEMLHTICVVVNKKKEDINLKK